MNREIGRDPLSRKSQRFAACASVLSIVFAGKTLAQGPESSQLAFRMDAVSVQYAEFLSDAARITAVDGPSPAFVSEPRRGHGMYLDLSFLSIGQLSFFASGSFEKLPMGYRLDARMVDHPGVPLPFDIQDLNLTTAFDRVSFGVGSEYKRKLGKRLSVQVEVAILRHFINVGQYYHHGVGAATDTTNTWVMGLSARIFQQSSTWHARARVGAEYAIAHRHSVGIYALFDNPFGDTFSDGKVILFGLTQYKTTLEFEQRGAIKGLCLAYRYSWPGRRKRIESWNDYAPQKPMKDRSL